MSQQFPIEINPKNFNSEVYEYWKPTIKNSLEILLDKKQNGNGFEHKRLTISTIIHAVMDLCFGFNYREEEGLYLSDMCVEKEIYSKTSDVYFKWIYEWREKNDEIDEVIEIKSAFFRDGKEKGFNFKNFTRQFNSLGKKKRVIDSNCKRENKYNNLERKIIYSVLLPKRNSYPHSKKYNLGCKSFILLPRTYNIFSEKMSNQKELTLKQKRENVDESINELDNIINNITISTSKIPYTPLLYSTI